MTDQPSPAAPDDQKDKGKEPFVPGEDRPDVKIDPNVRLTETHCP